MIDIHNLLARQLKRIGISDGNPPSPEQWKLLLQTLHRTYTEIDQERYLLERSMEISSQETLDLNSKLEQAQEIAHLGYWVYNKSEDKVTFSQEMYEIFDYSHEKPVPTFEALLDRVMGEEKNILANLANRAFSHGENFEIEAQIKTFDDQYRWCFFAGNPHLERDNTLIACISGIAIDITARKESETEMHQLNQKLISSARRAGMAEVASSVLHNVGNILNSVNVSVAFIQTNIQQADIESVIAVIQMLIDHQNTLQDYITNDPKGKLLPVFLLEAKKHLDQKIAEINTELYRLVENIRHIKDIVAIQGTLSGASGIMEDIVISEVIDAAIDLNLELLTKKGIILENETKEKFTLISDKNKIMQIMVNLIQNAKDAVIVAYPNKIKKISIQTKKINTECIEIIITDNGIGIAPENLTRMFSFGFTTKQKGHGFGLHSSALLAKELGGTLRVESKGIGFGAKFTLTLPLEAAKQRSASHVYQL